MWRVQAPRFWRAAPLPPSGWSDWGRFFGCWVDRVLIQLIPPVGRDWTPTGAMLCCFQQAGPARVGLQPASFRVVCRTWIPLRGPARVLMLCDDLPSRRRMLGGAIGAAGLVVGPACLRTGPLAATPDCHDGEDPTPPETEGPFFKPWSPERSDLREPGLPGQPVELSGLVLTRSCRVVVGATVDLWQADADGRYDRVGFRLRGHTFTDAGGGYVFRTIMPGLYPGRTRHFHVKVLAPGAAVLTTQFYFPGEKHNRTDGLFRPDLVLRVAGDEQRLQARFDVVLRLS